jgi:hypothetical protein
MNGVELGPGHPVHLGQRGEGLEVGPLDPALDPRDGLRSRV